MSDCSKRELIKLFNHGCNFALLLDRRLHLWSVEIWYKTHAVHRRKIDRQSKLVKELGTRSKRAS
jgi:hypothetical protein